LSRSLPFIVSPITFYSFSVLRVVAVALIVDVVIIHSFFGKVVLKENKFIHQKNAVLVIKIIHT
jgi:hypothetical protein